MLDPILLDRCVERFSRESGLVAVWIFGSAVSDRLREDSDVDFALYNKPGAELDLSAFGELVCDLEDILGRKADLGWLSSRNLVYAVQAFQTGQLIYTTDESAAMAFASRLQSLYLDLKQDRKVVEEAYCA
ncbi:nucleotidyltransferase domain-containing protein [Coraliomargarita sinensis]|uniref:Nucleotidyltransferase domain-containing protein n=1 Tax=Coraliomargarita sinensis TaxID=2174842 RepID=A0A317ZEE3_9BACT|nr:nucleotidyltransferase domain-containing protein [Coraliomargarita sinensis]PXA03696.1 nucleotidyltransferase domain-containing protein [Coraliomargarita sinensis]